MTWENRGNNRYYYRMKRKGDRVVSEYYGNGPFAEMLAVEDEHERHYQQERQRRKGEEREKHQALEKEISGLDEKFFQELKQALLLAVGPLADLILEDALADLNVSISEFPPPMAPELINILSEEIPREEKRTDFLKVMIPKIPK